MSKISIDLLWEIGNGKMTPGDYSNQHEITFTPKIKIICESISIGLIFIYFEISLE